MPTFQLIQDNGEISTMLKQYFEQNKLFYWSKNYWVVGIIGSQSSGKSFLLNHLFDTHFDVLNQKTGRHQTTKGIWIDNNNFNQLIILDIQGSDSKQRWETRTATQQRNALLGLALSHCLLINIWTTEVGRYSGSQYGIIKVIMQMNLKLIGQDFAKQIIFILRDYVDQQNLDNIKRVIRKDIASFWQELNLGEEFKKKKPEDFFLIEFFTMHHPKFQKKQFQKDVQDLKQILLMSKKSPHFLFKQFDPDFNLPIQTLSDYISQIWEIIKNNEDINLPQSKVIISNMRCKEIKEEAFNLIKQNLQQIDQYNSLSTALEDIQTKVLKYYDDKASSYSKKIYQEIRNSLNQQLNILLHSTFSQEAQKIRNEISPKIKEYLKQIKINMNNYRKVIDVGEFINYNYGEEFMKKIKYKKKEWVAQANNKWDTIKDQIFNKWKEDLLSQIINQINIQVKDLVDNQVTDSFNKLYQVRFQFWQVIRQMYSKVKNSFKQKLNQIINSMGLKKQSFSYLIKQLEDKITECFEFEINKKAENINFYLIQCFRQQFYFENGVPIKLKQSSNQNIKLRYSKTKQQNIKYLDLFQFSQLTQIQILLIPSTRKQEIISQLEIDCQIQLETTLRKLASINQHNIPKWIWILLIVFMIDDVIIWMMNPMFIIPVTSVGLSLVYFLTQRGYQNMLKMINMWKGLIQTLLKLK